MNLNNCSGVFSVSETESGFTHSISNEEESFTEQHEQPLIINSTSDINNLRSVNEIPLEYRTIFSNFRYFNIIQSQLLDVVLRSDQSVVLSAPTGSGKTVIFELAVVRFLINQQQCPQDSYKIIYIAPMKALCEERLVDWNTKFGPLGLMCISITGDSENIDSYSLLHNNVIITTPEKWDSLTRKWRENKKFVQLIKLFMIDEVHLVGENQRGATLEVIVSRMKTIQDTLVADSNISPGFQTIRFVGVSASVPNVEDMAEWLSTPRLTARWFRFSDEMRPVQLKKVVLAYPYNPSVASPFRFDLMLNYKLQSVLTQYSEGKPTLIFCNTRKSVEMTSQHIRQNLTINLSPQQKEILQTALQKISLRELKLALVSGIGFHHAGLSPDDRRIVEELFRNAQLPILVTTSTLAMGVNLPAHLVIIKSTKYYSQGEYQDYSESMLMQMIGRAGRPQYDSSATAVILTTNNDKEKFDKMIGGRKPIESSLHKNLAEHLNSEVVLRTITDLGVAMQWLSSTFLYIRARKNPRYYGLSMELTSDQIDKRLLDMCQIEINKLARAGMLVIDENDVVMTPTRTGLLMAKYCVAFETMKLFSQVTGTEVLQQMLTLISKCKEFSEVYLRVNEKKTLNLLNRCRNGTTIRFPFNGKIKTIDMKINCLIQADFGCLPILDQSLVTESQKIMRIGERISRCLAEYLETKGNCYSALLSSLILAKCFHVRLWENSPFVSKQLSGIGNAFSTALVAANKTTFQKLLNSNPRDIEMIINRKPPLGNTIQNQIERLPFYELTLNETKSPNAFLVDLKLCLTNVERVMDNSAVNVHSSISLLVGNTNNEIIVYEKYPHSYFFENPVITKTFEFPLGYEQEIKAHLISEDWVGIDCEARINSQNAVKDSEIKSRAQKTTRKELNFNDKQKSSHIQTFINTYFQQGKPVKKRKHEKETKVISSVSAKRKQTETIKKNRSSNISQEEWEQKQIREQNSCSFKDSGIEEHDLSFNSSGKTSRKTTLEDFIRDSTQVYQNLQKQKDGRLTSTQNIFKTSDLSATISNNSDITKSYTLSPMRLTKNQNVDDTPSTFSIIQTNNSSVTVKRREPNNTAPKRHRKLLNTMDDFEDYLHESIANENMGSSSFFEKFRRKSPPRLKYNLPVTQNKKIEINYDEIKLANENTSRIREKEASNETRENSRKTLTWRSPLISSPKMYYSPTKDSKHKTNLDAVNSFSMNPSINRSSTIEHKGNLTSDSINANDSMETSTSSNSKASSITRPTLKQNLLKRGCDFPISDEAFLQSQTQKEDTASTDNNSIISKNNESEEDEVISSSLLDLLGLSRNKSQKKDNFNITRTLNEDRKTSPADYYSQLVVDTNIKEGTENQNQYFTQNTRIGNDKIDFTDKAMAENDIKEHSEEENNSFCRKETREENKNLNLSFQATGNTNLVLETTDTSENQLVPFFNFSEDPVVLTEAFQFKSTQTTPRPESPLLFTQVPQNKSVQISFINENPDAMMQSSLFSVCDRSHMLSSSVNQNTSFDLGNDLIMDYDFLNESREIPNFHINSNSLRRSHHHDMPLTAPASGRSHYPNAYMRPYRPYCNVDFTGLPLTQRFSFEHEEIERFPERTRCVHNEFGATQIDNRYHCRNLYNSNVYGHPWLPQMHTRNNTCCNSYHDGICHENSGRLLRERNFPVQNWHYDPRRRGNIPPTLTPHHSEELTYYCVNTRGKKNPREE